MCLCTFGYITGPDEVSLFAVSPVECERISPVVTLPESAGLQNKAAAAHMPPLNTSGVLARGHAHDALRFVGQASCFVLRRSGGIARLTSDS